MIVLPSGLGAFGSGNGTGNTGGFIVPVHLLNAMIHLGKNDEEFTLDAKVLHSRERPLVMRFIGSCQDEQADTII